MANIDNKCADLDIQDYHKDTKDTFGLLFDKQKELQSRLGFDPWLQPYTDRTIERLGKSGTKRMAIVTPAFVSDCLETLEEIAMEGKEIFEEVGGDEFTTIPCLNDNNDWVNLISNWVDNWKDNGKCF